MTEKLLEIYIYKYSINRAIYVTYKAKKSIKYEILKNGIIIFKSHRQTRTIMCYNSDHYCLSKVTSFKFKK